MAVSEHSTERAESVADRNRRTQCRSDTLAGRYWVSHRLLVRVSVWIGGLGSISGTAGAHGSPLLGETPVSFVVVVGLPIIAGFGGGAVALRRWQAEDATLADHRVSIVLGLLLIGLGLTLAVVAVMERPSLGITSGAVGALLAVVAARHGSSMARRYQANLTLGAVSVHRLLEGVALGTLYSSGTTIGLLGAIVVAGHTAIETAAASGLYGQYRRRAIWAIVSIQGCYTIGASVGVIVAATIPELVHIGTVALAGGILFGVGLTDTQHSVSTGAHDSIH